ncbi:nucleotidyltransferase domain-containing protein [Massilia sp. IC2-477]|uniref:nucleotidyltransferase domain-containing protein n=1 Tax=Massilia sp. IC2-477 TaxID=2887198 RepID=UPI001D10FA16|nr:nucleotidyltransferase domain-containing protein [Massilia sp. IC2-477]MCC2956110.1 nucleotidyltransferase domain-containing protein [Massilia sp. IC2-477]
MSLPTTLPAAHRQFIQHALEVLRLDPRIVGLAGAGSLLTGEMDEFSDVDLLIVTEPDQHAALMSERGTLAARLGSLLASFSGEHVGEPRLLICLYDAPLLHVDLKFVALGDVHQRVEDPAVLWERDGRVTAALGQGEAHYPQPDPTWIEDRFWIWVHYGAGKIGRGELFEAIDFLSFIRSAVLGPLALRRAGARPQGVRRIETRDPAFAAALAATVPRYDALDCLRALQTCIALYRELREERPRGAAEAAAVAYVEGIRARLLEQGATA